MTTEVRSEPKSASRRAVLAGAVGGLGAWALAAVGRASPTQAADGTTVHVGDELNGVSVTKITNTTDGAKAIWGSAPNGAAIGVYGTSGSGAGVRGDSDGDAGVVGFGPLGVYAGGGIRGVVGVSNGEYGVVGANQVHMTGVIGFSGDTQVVPAPKAKTGVYGYANQDSNAKGIYGESVNGYAGYFAGRLYLSKYQEMAETSAPPAPGANKARLFVRDNGSGKTQLCVVFNTGGVLVIKTQP